MMDANANEISVVICIYTFDRFAQALEAIASISRQSIQAYEIIVVVDHNPQLLCELARHVSPDVKLVANMRERGLSGARNTGLDVSTGSLVTFIDDDVVAEPDCLERLYECFAVPEVMGAGALIEPLWAEGHPSWFPDEFLWVVGCSYRGLKAGPTRNLLGAAMCIRRSVFENAGEFDSDLGRTRSKLPLGNEETELCIRASKVNPDGYFVFDPLARVAHRVPPGRTTWTYFIKRCYAEGLSKAHLTELVGANRSLSSERSYVVKTLSQSIARNLKQVLSGDPSGVLRVVAVMLGLFSTVAGFALGRARVVKKRLLKSNQQVSDTEIASTEFGRTKRRLRLPKVLTDRLGAAFGDQRVLFFSAGMLALGTAASAALGFIYWWVAARSFTPSAVGFAAAAISLMNFLGHLGEIGFGALLMGEMHRYPERPNRIISTGLIIAFGCSALFGLAYIIVNTFFPVQLGEIAEAGAGRIIFVLGCAFTGMTLVLDQALVGLSESPLQVARNVTFAVVKLVLLTALPLLVATMRAVEAMILTTWVVGQIFSILLLCLILRRRLSLISGRPALGFLKPLLPRVLGHHGLNLANIAPGLLMPFVVTVVLTPSINAAFYAAWTLVNVAFVVPASLATVVYAVGSQQPMGLAEKLRASLGSSIAISVVVAVGCFVFSSFILSLFSPLYAQIAAPSFKLLSLSLFPIAIKYHYVAIQRLRNRMAPASVLVALGCILELTGAIFGGRGGGLFGLTAGWLLGLTIETAMMAPVIVDALMPNSRAFQVRERDRLCGWAKSMQWARSKPEPRA